MASSATPPPDNQDFATAITEVEQDLAALKARHTQIEADTQQKQQLEARRQEVKQEFKQNKSPELKAELERIQQEIETIAVNLENQLISFNSLKQPFWQAVRFLGLGIVIGWFLKSWSG
jgi:predicted RNase H-like nuclease (RuvC/YqgF family)